MEIYCFSKCGVFLKGFNPHLPFGDHLFGDFIFIFIGTKGFCTFSIVYIIDEGVQKSNLVFNSDLEGVC
jgi:hypothetical protein